ncbi:glpC, partial [Symbiodinium necroappetens]
MCFMVSCPYVPPHEFDLDFPHLMLRYRAAEQRQGKGERGLAAELTKTDRNGKLGSLLPALANWAIKVDNGMTRPLMERLADVHREAWLPKFHGTSFEERARGDGVEVNRDAPAFGRKVVLYATCFVNFNHPSTGSATRQVLAKNGVETQVVYPECCGMPQLEQGKVESVAQKARRIAGELEGWVDQGYEVVALTSSCALMLKFEWPLLLPEDATVKKLSQATYDITEYVVDIANKEGLAEGLGELDGGVALHIACHARAQNMGMKARDMMKLIPQADIKMLPRCSGHGGTWGVRKQHFDQAMKVGKPAMRDALKAEKTYVSSECPLAALHLLQGMDRLAQDKPDGPQPTEQAPRAEAMSTAVKRRIERGDILPMTEYESQRKERRKKLVEMLYIEKGGEEQIADELSAYNPLIPQGRELVATVMFEIDDPVRRKGFLSKLGGIEETAFIEIDGAERLVGKPEEDVDRTTADGKASSVQFIHFPFTDAQAEAMKTPGTKVVLGFTHPAYSHMA